MNGSLSADELTRLYAALPAISCTGACWRDCGPIAMSGREAERIERATGAPLRSFDGEKGCGYLTADRRCSIYELRPLVCRLYGVGRGLLCPHGCVPEVILDEPAVAALFARAERLSNGRVVETAPGLLDAVATLRRAGLRLRGDGS